VTVVLCKIIYKSLFLYYLTSFHLTLPKNVDEFELPIPKLRENSLLHIVKYISYKLTVTVSLLKILWKSLFFSCLTTFHWTLHKNVDEFGLPIPKLSENTLLHMSNTLLKAFLTFQASWQWQWDAYLLERGQYRESLGMLPLGDNPLPLFPLFSLLFSPCEPLFCLQPQLGSIQCFIDLLCVVHITKRSVKLDTG